jgi:hypothetical protein
MGTLKIERFRFDGLKNMEFTLMAPHAIKIAEKYPCINLLEKRFNAVKSFLPELDKIEAQERKWHNAHLLNEAESNRDGFVNALIRCEHTYARVVIKGYEEASEKLTALFDKHKRDIATDSNIAETQRIYNLVEDVERTPGMLDVLATFSLIPIYNSLKENNIRFDELWQQRNSELSEIDRVDSKTIRLHCSKALHELYNGIEYQAAENDDAAWGALIRELSQMNGYYKQRLKARITHRKNKGKKEDEPLITPPEASSPDIE